MKPKRQVIICLTGLIFGLLLPATSQATEWHCVISAGDEDYFYTSDHDETGVQGPGATTCWVPGWLPDPFWFNVNYT